MIVDEKATKLARARQKAGFKRLDEAFALPSQLVRLRGFQVAPSRARGPYGPAFVAAIAPLRHKPGCPRPRSDRAWLRHRKRKLARAARRRNRTAA